MIVELPVYPRTQYTSSGIIGTRVWAIDAGDDLHEFLVMVCESHWPEKWDCVPFNVQEGAFMEGVNNKSAGVRTVNTIGPLAKYGKIKITAQYQLLRMTNCWPTRIPKPRHPIGTTLTLQAQSSCQVLTVSPTGMRAGGPGENCTGAEITEAQLPSTVTRVIIPITEYHLTCDRMTGAQVDVAFGKGGEGFSRDWDNYEGTVNMYQFLGAIEGTLLFDSYRLEETFVPHPDSPCRYRLTAVFKQRNIMGIDGKPILDCSSFTIPAPPGSSPFSEATSHPIGWNHDLIPNGGTFGWRFIRMQAENGDCNNRKTSCRPRYPYSSFAYLFLPYAIPDYNENEQCDPRPVPGDSIGDICETSGAEVNSYSQDIPSQTSDSTDSGI